MAERTFAPTPRTFADLVTQVRAALIAGQSHVDRAYLETYRETGLLIDAHILLFKQRAGYGEQVIPRLARALDVSDRLLYRCLRFVREYPILTARSELGWAHYRVLLEVADKSERTALETAARKNHWTSAELERRVRALNAVDVTPLPASNGGPAPARPQTLVPRRGTPGVCKVIEVAGAPVVDLGFACYRDLPVNAEYQAGDFVRVTDAGLRRAEGATKADLFAYPAEVLKVVDGDTLWVKIVLSPGIWVKQKLRLRDLDCPEVDTAEGKAAKRFTETLVKSAESIWISTTKPDKYDRYLADVFVTSPGGEEVFLNNALLASGLAVVKKSWEFGDWGVEG